jgi:uncharacterized membrane protein
MESKARLFGHPVHQMLVVFPLGLLGTSLVFDLMHLVGEHPTAAEVAYRLISAGLLAGLVAAPWGTIDWLALPAGTRAKRIGAWHGAGNVLVLLLFLLSWWWRRDAVADPPVLAYLMSFAGAGLSLATAWLGGELVDRLGVGVSPGAHLNARSSLEGPVEPAGPPDREPATR